MYEVLESSDMHHKVAQALLGPNEDLEPAESIGLVHYGVIIEGEGEILPFVPGFSWFLRQKVQSANLWMMWTSVESELRDRIHERLVSRFGSPNWLSAFCAAHPSLRSALIDADERYQKDSLTVREPCGLLAFTYPKDLFRMLLADWSSLGQPILGASRRYWEDRLELLARVRTPMAHSRERAIRSSDRDFARSILGEISGRLRGVSTDD